MDRMETGQKIREFKCDEPQYHRAEGGYHRIRGGRSPDSLQMIPGGVQELIEIKGHVNGLFESQAFEPKQHLPRGGVCKLRVEDRRHKNHREIGVLDLFGGRGFRQDAALAYLYVNIVYHNNPFLFILTKDNVLLTIELYSQAFVYEDINAICTQKNEEKFKKSLGI